MKDWTDDLTELLQALLVNSNFDFEVAGVEFKKVLDDVIFD